jgi:hypothetical protein
MQTKRALESSIRGPFDCLSISYAGAAVVIHLSSDCASERRRLLGICGALGGEFGVGLTDRRTKMIE